MTSALKLAQVSYGIRHSKSLLRHGPMPLDPIGSRKQSFFSTESVYRLGSLQRSFLADKAPDKAIDFATPLFSTNAYAGKRWVIDVSGDGSGNTRRTSQARDKASAAGVEAINGLSILSKADSLFGT